jgi:hypothetical protein
VQRDDWRNRHASCQTRGWELVWRHNWRLLFRAFANLLLRPVLAQGGYKEIRCAHHLPAALSSCADACSDRFTPLSTFYGGALNEGLASANKRGSIGAWKGAAPAIFRVARGHRVKKSLTMAMKPCSINSDGIIRRQSNLEFLALFLRQRLN